MQLRLLFIFSSFFVLSVQTSDSTHLIRVSLKTTKELIEGNTQHEVQM